MKTAPEIKKVTCGTCSHFKKLGGTYGECLIDKGPRRGVNRIINQDFQKITLITKTRECDGFNP